VRAADDGRGLLIESHGLFEGANAARVKLNRSVEFVPHLAGERNAAAEDSELESFVTESVGKLGVNVGVVGRYGNSALPVVHGFVEVSVGIIDGREPGERFGIVRIAGKPLLRNAVELAEVLLLKQGFAVCGPGEAGGKEGAEENGSG
jgi:hypothetical protein